MRMPLLILLALPVAAIAQTAQTSAKPQMSASKDDKVICKSFAEVGSLIATHKECKTRREWDIEHSENQRRLGDCINTGASTGSRC